VDAPQREPVTRYLQNWHEGSEGPEQVFAAVYEELRTLASRMLRSEAAGHTLQPTALVHELYMRLGMSQPPDWKDRTHFFAIAAKSLRRILIDHARASQAERRGGAQQVQVSLELADPSVTCSYEDLLRIDEALTALEKVDARAARVVELRFFGGLSDGEVAAQLEVAEITVKRDWKFARAWLAERLR
jgi:RNA polymerase sigma factor (TIGR02999 family)